MSSAQTVLIVEDNALVAKFYRMALERAGGFACLVTEDVPAMLESVRAGCVQAAILDVSLRNAEWEGRRVDGLELTRLLKQASARPLPVLLATAHAMAGDQERLLAMSGADGYLVKPVYDAAVLVENVRRLLGEGKEMAS